MRLRGLEWKMLNRSASAAIPGTGRSFPLCVHADGYIYVLHPLNGTEHYYQRFASCPARSALGIFQAQAVMPVGNRFIRVFIEEFVLGTRQYRHPARL